MRYVTLWIPVILGVKCKGQPEGEHITQTTCAHVTHIKYTLTGTW